MDVTVQHLQDTGVGRTVNALRKESGKVGLAARSLVNKWKAMVVAEDSDQDASLQDSKFLSILYINSLLAQINY